MWPVLVLHVTWLRPARGRQAGVMEPGAQQGFRHVRHGPARMGDEGRGVGAPAAVGVMPAAQHREEAVVAHGQAQRVQRARAPVVRLVVEDAVGAGLGDPQALAPLCEGVPGRAGDPQPQITGKQSALGQDVRLTVDNPGPTLTIGHGDRITGKRAEKPNACSSTAPSSAPAARTSPPPEPASRWARASPNPSSSASPSSPGVAASSDDALGCSSTAIRSTPAARANRHADGAGYCSGVLHPPRG